MEYRLTYWSPCAHGMHMDPCIQGVNCSLSTSSIPPPRPGLDQVDWSNRNLLQACDGQGWLCAKRMYNPCVRVGEGEKKKPPSRPARK